MNSKAAWLARNATPESWPRLVGLLRRLLPGLLRVAGILVFLLLTVSPTTVGRSVRRQLRPIYDSTAAVSSDAKGNPLPLQMQLSTGAQEVLQEVAYTTTLGHYSQQHL